MKTNTFATEDVLNKMKRQLGSVLKDIEIDNVTCVEDFDKTGDMICGKFYKKITVIGDISIWVDSTCYYFTSDESSYVDVFICSMIGEDDAMHSMDTLDNCSETIEGSHIDKIEFENIVRRLSTSLLFDIISKLINARNNIF